jgi:hypothetical protein
MILNSNKKTVLSLVLTFLALGGFACNLAGIQPPAPSYNVSPSAEALQSFKDKWRNLTMVTPSGPFSMTFTEAELTSAVDSALQDAQANGETVPVQNLQIFLRNGTITVYGQARFDPLTVTGEIGLLPTVSPQGQVDLTLVSVDFGPLEVDETLLDQLVDRLERSINEPIQTSPLNIALTDIRVADGEITLTGTLTP